MFQRTEVLTIMAHLLITLAVLGGYLYTVAIGQPDETLKGLLMVIGGYWFGAMARNKVTESIAKRKGDKTNE